MNFDIEGLKVEANPKITFEETSIDLDKFHRVMKVLYHNSEWIAEMLDQEGELNTENYPEPDEPFINLSEVYMSIDIAAIIMSKITQRSLT